MTACFGWVFIGFFLGVLSMLVVGGIIPLGWLWGIVPFLIVFGTLAWLAWSVGQLTNR